MTEAATHASAGRSQIRVLSEGVAAKIAAGEVVERPVSVVKELVENALDAGARRVSIELEEGGIHLIRISDDGCGMEEHDAVLAFTRHATSKLREAEDLERIATLGFRGEALPSIAAVAIVELTSRVRDAVAAVHVRTDGGVVAETRAAGAPVGTVVTVRDLFGPVPARRKFLKTPATELGHVTDLVARLALANLEVHFRLQHQGRDVAVYPAVSTMDERARQVFGAERVRGGRAFDDDRHGMRIEGFAFSPQTSFASGRYLQTLVNGRTVRDRGLHHAVMQGYGSLIPRGRWPGAVVRLAVPPADVDVNVHPTKQEVRFRVARVVHDAVVDVIRRAIATGDEATRSRSEAVGEALGRYVASTPQREPRLPLGSTVVSTPRSDDAPMRLPERPASVAGGLSELRFVGQLFRGYLVCEGHDRLVLVDQHAAHERIALERLLAEREAGAIERQALLSPTPIELQTGQVEALAGARDELQGLGFELEPFGDATVLLRAMPALLGDADPRLVVEDIADGLGALGSHAAAGEAAEAILGRIACHSVIRVGQSLHAAEVAALLADLDRLSHGSSCAHGRPVSVEFSRGQIERMFGR